MNVNHPSISPLRQCEAHAALTEMLAGYAYTFKELVRVYKGRRYLCWYILATECVAEDRIKRIMFDLQDMDSYLKIDKDHRVTEVTRKGNTCFKGLLRLGPPSKLVNRKEYYEDLHNNYVIVKPRDGE